MSMPCMLRSRAFHFVVGSRQVGVGRALAEDLFDDVDVDAPERLELLLGIADLRALDLALPDRALRVRCEVHVDGVLQELEEVVGSRSPLARSTGRVVQRVVALVGVADDLERDVLRASGGRRDLVGHRLQDAFVVGVEDDSSVLK